ncbi:hypothetical protein H4Q26_010517 [Puccinia striiformis f. sp. tritici PST-130]|uniref:Uncharacterized protein n=1 Tax=Puccinia striiformis f. sp. tritici PST-78 TaxID=1165861 RepID=A0A0L0VNQ7_9BASI|nr:hypothetical protein H4Q26_010517 [Puccinia striiformis f. sp. tritici PST-130]KNF00842.1 hypothetical protein PSTG_05976 [Puccinia striiformis f. sp. tritici PST-78]
MFVVSLSPRGDGALPRSPGFVLWDVPLTSDQSPGYTLRQPLSPSCRHHQAEPIQTGHTVQQQSQRSFSLRNARMKGIHI